MLDQLDEATQQGQGWRPKTLSPPGPSCVRPRGMPGGEEPFPDASAAVGVPAPLAAMRGSVSRTFTPPVCTCNRSKSIRRKYIFHIGCRRRAACLTGSRAGVSVQNLHPACLQLHNNRVQTSAIDRVVSAWDGQVRKTETC